MDEIKELKAKVYDLLVQKQAIEVEMQKYNQQIIEKIEKQNKETKEK